LDSQLAACVLKQQGVEVVGLSFESPFFGSRAARKAAEQIGVPLHVVDFTADIIEVLSCPKHGFGSCMNPCIDCHARMLHRAGGMLRESGCHLLSTGEVLNERPMSQSRRSLAIVARESGYEDLVLRPLSALLLPETRPEQLRWVDRSRLLSLEGRSRRRQMKLAVQFGIKEYPTPAGGCLLTEPAFCRRLRDLKEHGGMGDDHALRQLRCGRHFRLAPDVKLIVGRNHDDNEALKASSGSSDIVLSMEDVMGPTALLPGHASEEALQLAARICARYSDAPAGRPAGVRVVSSAGARLLQAVAAPREELERLLV
jgi:hypothetical protein